MSTDAKLNSDPEVLLRKRRNADITRLEKQELVKKRKQEELRQKADRKCKFIRAETIVSTTLATQREKERIKRISKLESKKNGNEKDHIPSDKDFILKITEHIDENDKDDSLVKEKIVYDGKPTLLFVIRIKGPTAVKIPKKAFKVLNLLRLIELNNGVFVKLTPQVYSLLKIVAPYIVVGRPSLSSIRSLIQKRSRTIYQAPSDVHSEPREIILNDNNIIEEKLGEDGIICMEDIIHEISALGESFYKCNFFLLPFKLSNEINGFSALSKLQKLKQMETFKKKYKISNASTAPIIEVDIDSMISKLN